MLWVAITGGLGSGKSTVSSRLRSLGYDVIDADEISHQLLIPGTDAYQSVLSYFGPDILNSDQTINRPRLGQRVFSNKTDLEMLESILHPRIQKKVQDLRQQLSSKVKIAFYDVPLLYEKKLENNFDFVIVVNAPLELRIERVKKRSGLSEEEIKKRISAQISLEDKIKLTKFVIQNDSDLMHLDHEIHKVLNQLY